MIGAAPTARSAEARTPAAEPLLELPERPSAIAELWRFRHFVIRGNSIGVSILRAAGFTPAEAGAIAFRLSEEPELVH